MPKHDPNESTHGGHRARLKQRFLDHGLEDFEPHQILELLLFYSIPRSDTNPLAHRLLNRFGSLEAVFSATPEQLMQVEGVSEHTATLLTFILPLVHRSSLEHGMPQARVKLQTPLQALQALSPLFRNRVSEAVYLIGLNELDEVLGVVLLGQGEKARVAFSSRRLICEAMRLNAARVLLAHNHPGGSLLPSPADLNHTQAASDALAFAEVDLVDHLIFDIHGNYYSIRLQDTVSFEAYHPPRLP